MPSLPGAPEILVILLVALLVFGPNKLPEVGRQVGKGLREFRKFQEHIKNEIDDVIGADSEPDEAPKLPPKDVVVGFSDTPRPNGSTEPPRAPHEGIEGATPSPPALPDDPTP
jgi:TatA/E family protein of Tat protein translocase